MVKWIKIFNSKNDADKAIKNGKPVKLRIGTRELCLTKFNGQYYVTANSCPHQRESLNKGTINYTGEIICPLHFYRFDLRTGRECQGRTGDLATYRVKVEESGMFVYC